jgi:uroporphyrin-III C-methyltransferase/precorrin-2 dehydrogenase/sirohydrochlorin ferrochelatase
VYLSGLVLKDRDVLVVGGGQVAERRVPRLLAAGAMVRLVSPVLTPNLTALAADNAFAWTSRPFTDTDLDVAWYALALTDDPDVNAAVAAGAERRRIFCVRGDLAEGGSAWTPASGTTGEATVGVVSTAGPRAAARARDAAVAALALDPDTDAPAGWVTLVGGGPGDPGLLTVAGLRALRAADVVAYDRLAPVSVLAEACPDAHLIDVGKVPHGPFTPQEAINALLIEHARAGRRVVRLKGGDSFVFGRGGEEWQACAEAGVPVRVVPGVSSAVAGPALAGIPVTHRGLSQGFTVVSAHVPPGDPRSDVAWEALARSGTTLVILMGVGTLEAVCRTLVSAGLPPHTPAAVIADAARPTMRVVRGDVATIAAAAREAGIAPPAITVIGAVAGIALANDHPST